MQTPEHYGQPTEIPIPLEMQKYLAQLCQNHLKTLNVKFSDQLKSTDTTKESFWVAGELIESDGKIFCSLKGMKQAVTQP